MKVRAVIFDVSGTVLDFGSRAPVRAFVELFRRHGVEITEAEARRPMGSEKRDHIAALLAEPAIAARWARTPTTPDLDALYDEFTPIQKELLPYHCDVLPGIAELTASLRACGIRFANTTGFSRSMMEVVIPRAAEAGYAPDAWMCPDDVGAGRPAPWMMFEAARRLGVYPMSQVVKVGDTPVDVAEAHAAGAWAVAVLSHGNEVGLSAAEWGALPPADQQSRRQAAHDRLQASAPHFIIEQTADLMPVLDAIEKRLAQGQRP